MKTKIDKSLEEVWDMKALARENFLKSGYSNYAEYLKIRQLKIDEFFNEHFKDKINLLEN
jgi:hypothetical protein